MPPAQTAPVGFSRTERRKYPRKDVIGSQLVSVNIEPHNSAALLLDVGDGGLAVQNLTTLKGKHSKQLSFRIPDTREHVEFTAEVAWSDEDRVGMRFTDADQESREALARWIEALPEGESEKRPPARVTRLGTQHAPAPAQAVARPLLRDEDFYSCVARARVLTCATGAAIAWWDEDGMTCRASTGLAPGVGVRVQEHGLSGECMRTADVVRCDDTETDPRVDPDVCRQLNLRAVVIVPVVSSGTVIGLIEVFSSKSHAFTDADIAGLRELARQCSTPAQHAPSDAVEKRDELLLHGFNTSEPETKARKISKLRTFVPWVVAGTVLLGGLQQAYRRATSASANEKAAQEQNSASGQPVGIPREITEAYFGSGEAAARKVIHSRRAKEEADQGQKADAQAARNNSSKENSRPNAGKAQAEVDLPPAFPAKTRQNRVPVKRASASSPGGFEPSQPISDGSGGQLTPARLLYSVKPQYPPPAVNSDTEGSVSLRVSVGADGKVRDVAVVSGDATLAQAAVAAVRQWRYEPFRVGGRAVEGNTNVTINFAASEQ